MKNFFHRVRRGDTVSMLSELYNISPFLIIADNNLNDEPCEGDLLIIRNIKGLAIYNALPRDDFESVSFKLGADVNDLRSLNPSPYIYVGQQVFYFGGDNGRNGGGEKNL